MLDLEELAQRVSKAAQLWAPDVEIRNVKPLLGGSSSLTYIASVFHGPTRQLVVKSAFPGAPAIANRDVLRQARLLKALDGVPDVRVPHVFFEDSGAPPDVPPLFAMSYEAGESFEPNLDVEQSPTSAETVSARARAAARMLAALHSVNPTDVGLGDETPIALEGEVARWSAAFATVTDDLRQGAAACGARLQSDMPSASPPTLTHGDWRQGNLICEGSSIRAAIDWEIWACSDSRLDLAWYLLSADGDLNPMAVRKHPGIPPPDELLLEYEAEPGVQAADLPWFTALALYKMAAATALITKHRRRVGDFVAVDIVQRISEMLDHAITLTR